MGGVSASHQGKWGLGGGHRKRNPYFSMPVSTGNSGMANGQVTLDPSIRSIQDKGLGRIDDQYAQTEAYGNELIGNTRSLRNRFLGNQSAYAEAQMNPLRQQVSERRGELERSNSLRGVAGSSFGDQSRNTFDFESQRALQDASANVEMQQLQALTGIDAQMTQQMFGKIATQMQLNGQSLDVAKTRLEQELRALGLGLEQIKVMTKGFEDWAGRQPYETGTSGSYSQGGSGGGSPSAGSGGGGSPGCFVAEVLYGVGSDKTLTIRAYVGSHANDRTVLGAFFRLYIKYGRKWADTIEEINIIKPIARIVWDKFHRMALAEKK